MKIWFSLAALLILAGCASKPKGVADDAAATPVEVSAATVATMHHLVTAEAVLFPLNQATIVPKINAPVRKFLVQRGDHVKQGQLLAVLEDADLRATTTESRELYRQAEANLEITRASTLPDDLTKAKSDAASALEAMKAAKALYDNRVLLFKEGALAQKLVDDAKVALAQAASQYETANQHLASLQNAGQASQLKSSEAQANAAKAHYKSSEAQSSYGDVRSPISGIVADRGVSVGEVASSGSALFTIVNISRVVARANVPVNEASLVRRGQIATIKGPGLDIQGKVTVVSPAVDVNTTTVQVWVEAANPAEALKLGSSVIISIEAGDVPNAIVVPMTALLASDEGGEKVMVAMADGTAQERKVVTGVRNGDDVQIISGVKAGDRVITRGGLGLDDKAKIETGKSGDDK